MRKERRKNPDEHAHACAVKWVIMFVGLSMLAALIGGIAGIFMKSMANEHSKDMITGSFSFAQMALTGLLGLLAKTGLEASRAGDPGEPPLQTEVVNKPSEPVPTTEAPAEGDV